MKNTPDLSTAAWRKSSYSDGGADNRVEVADGYLGLGLVPVRDSKVPDGPAVVFGAASWASFVSKVRESE
ncbi:DUF397 domain-containing protein [Streptomyces sp. NBC_00414]|uniref:DUF397 domain-containing protein n=1 Tax=Streptomyces sp. NBC_00414 TaxID=2975739 RepID=UPI002E1CB3C9